MTFAFFHNVEYLINNVISYLDVLTDIIESLIILECIRSAGSVKGRFVCDFIFLRREADSPGEGLR